MVATQFFFKCSSLFREDEPNFDSYFSNGLVQPPTRICVSFFLGQKGEELKLVLLDEVCFMCWYFDLAASFSEV